MANTKKEDELDLLKFHLCQNLGFSRDDERLNGLLRMIEGSHIDATGVSGVKGLVDYVLTTKMDAIKERVRKALDEK